MKSKHCPNCGKLLIEDAWEETVVDVHDGSILVDSFPAMICSWKRGFFQRLEEVNDED
jgi:hypothetical protein